MRRKFPVTRLDGKSFGRINFAFITVCPRRVFSLSYRVGIYVVVHFTSEVVLLQKKNLHGEHSLLSFLTPIFLCSCVCPQVYVGFASWCTSLRAGGRIANGAVCFLCLIFFLLSVSFNPPWCCLLSFEGFGMFIWWQFLRRPFVRSIHPVDLRIESFRRRNPILRDGPVDHRCIVSSDLHNECLRDVRLVLVCCIVSPHLIYSWA